MSVNEGPYFGERLNLFCNSNRAKAADLFLDGMMMTDHEFKFLTQLAFRYSGIVLSSSKRDMVYGRVIKRIRQLQMTGFSEYCLLLKQEPDGEITAFVNAITTNLTAFFREHYHFDFLQQVALPEFKRNNQDRRIRIWSAGCSTGQEPYSIAMSIESKLRYWDPKILATDLDSDVLCRAKQGCYNDLSGIPVIYLPRYCEEIDMSKRYQMVSEIKQLVTFKQLNLLSRWPMKGSFDAIFCRNVLIYFNDETKKEVVKRFYSMLKPGGYLFIGHSESLRSLNTDFKLIGQTIYQR